MVELDVFSVKGYSKNTVMGHVLICRQTHCKEKPIIHDEKDKQNGSYE